MELDLLGEGNLMIIIIGPILEMTQEISMDMVDMLMVDIMMNQGIDNAGRLMVIDTRIIVDIFRETCVSALHRQMLGDIMTRSSTVNTEKTITSIIMETTVVNKSEVVVIFTKLIEIAIDMIIRTSTVIDR